MILGDYHTHTTYSHGTGTVLDSVKKAAEVGLKQIAITDHGFKHRLYNVKRKKWAQVKADILEANEKFPSVRTLVGMEANLLDSRGTVDVEESDLQDIDILICGFHLFSKSTSFKEFFKFNMPALMSGITRKTSVKRMVSNTDAYIKAMERYPIDIISHPFYGIKVDLKELAAAAAHYGIFLELNGKKISFSAKDAQIMQEAGARFIISSDAHSADRVGEISVPLEFARQAGIELESIVNWNKLPVFRRTNRI